MNNEDRHASETNQVASPDRHDVPAAPLGLSAKGTARRRFAKAGAGATGVLLTLHSQPGMACTYCGISPSAAMSAIGQNRNVTLSHHGPAPVCSGLPPSTWCNSSSWPSGCHSSDSFHKYFSCSRNSPYYNVTCKSILSGASCDTSRMGQYLMATYLNVMSGRINFLTIESLEDIWNGWVTHGYYQPMPGQFWYSNDIVGYLYGTMD